MGEGSQGSQHGESSDHRAARVAMIGYGAEAREQALRLRAVGWHVAVVLRPGGMSWIRAVADGFRPVLAPDAVEHADVVVVQLPEAEQPAMWACCIAPHLADGALVVFAHGAALYSGAIEVDRRVDVVLVTGRDEPGATPTTPPSACRVAVHQDVTGRALERAAGFARAAFGDPSVGTTTLAAEVETDLSELVDRMGGVEALLAEWDRVLANPSHEPDEATLRYYERLRETVVTGARSPAISKPPSSRMRVDAPPRAGSRKRGAA